MVTPAEYADDGSYVDPILAFPLLKMKKSTIYNIQNHSKALITYTLKFKTENGSKHRYKAFKPSFCFIFKNIYVQINRPASCLF